MFTDKPGQYFFPLGSRELRLTYPPQRGSDIWIIQRWLNRATMMQPAWGLTPITESGVLTSQTLVRLRQLSKQFATWQPWEIVEHTYTMLGQRSGTLAAEGRPFGARCLILGDEGDDVCVLQNRLVAANRRMAMILGRPADGVYDSRTARLVRAFQRNSLAWYAGLKATGQVFADTLMLVWDRTILGGRELGVGARGLDVLALQELLWGTGYGQKRDGNYDQRMAETVAEWQREKGLAVTGAFSAGDYWRLGLERGY